MALIQGKKCVHCSSIPLPQSPRCGAFHPDKVWRRRRTEVWLLHVFGTLGNVNEELQKASGQAAGGLSSMSGFVTGLGQVT